MSLSTGVARPDLVSVDTTLPLIVSNPSRDVVSDAPHHLGSSGVSQLRQESPVHHDQLPSVLSRDMNLLDKDALLDVVSLLLIRIKALEDSSVYMQRGLCTSSTNHLELQRSCAEVVAACHFRLAVAHRVTRLRLASPASSEDVLPSAAEGLLAHMFAEADDVFASLSGSLNALLQPPVSDK
ncbi:hypothetical protein B0H11DRAFT_2250684 [Mycena galericulata]|nr:hypothetical protein B0H11DRAFT_2250684 [Mycena galericulata]